MDILASLLKTPTPVRTRTSSMSIKGQDSAVKGTPSRSQYKNQSPRQERFNRKSIQMKKALDQHQVIYQTINLLKNQTQQTINHTKQLKQRNSLLVQKYQTIIQTINSLNPQQITQDLIQVRFLCQSSLKSSLRTPTQYLIKSRQSIRKSNNIYIQTQQQHSTIHQINEDMKKLQQQNKQLRQKLQWSEKKRQDKMSSLKDIMLGNMFFS